MKKFFAVLLAAAFAASAIPALAEYYDQPKLGISIDLPDEVPNLSLSPITDADTGALGVRILFVNADVMTPYLEACHNALDSGDAAAQEKAKEDYKTAAEANTGTYAVVIGVPAASLDAAKEACGITDAYTEMGVNGDHTYFSAVYDLAENAGLSDESKALYEQYKPYAEDIVKTTRLIPIETEKAVSPIGEFTTVDMNGNAVDSGIFGNADLTVLNVWATNCNPCIGEMPELGAWAKQLPENVQIIGLIIDVEDTSDKTYERAQDILEVTGVEFRNLLMNDSLEDFVDSLGGTPATLFLDRNGVSVHDTIKGPRVNEYKQAVSDFLNK